MKLSVLFFTCIMFGASLTFAHACTINREALSADIKENAVQIKREPSDSDEVTIKAILRHTDPLKGGKYTLAFVENRWSIAAAISVYRPSLGRVVMFYDRDFNGTIDWTNLSVKHRKMFGSRQAAEIFYCEHVQMIVDRNRKRKFSGLRGSLNHKGE